MSVKTKITLDQINFLSKKIDLKFIGIENSTSGISDSVYILTLTNKKKYILKLYENSSKQKVLNEITLLKKIEHLNISKPLHIFEEYTKPLVLYSFLDGASPENIEKEHLKQMACFLKTLHNIEVKRNSNVKSFEISSLINEFSNLENLNKNIKEEFFKRLEIVKDIDLSINSSIVHGDIFPDNTKFIGYELNGVYDFSEVFVGNRYIDLAIVINSWCFNKNHELDKILANIFIKEYSEELNLQSMGKYLLYVNLYYALRRYINLQKNLFLKEVCYKEYLKKFDNTLFLIGRKN